MSYKEKKKENSPEGGSRIPHCGVLQVLGRRDERQRGNRPILKQNEEEIKLSSLPTAPSTQIHIPEYEEVSVGMLHKATH